MNYHNITTDDMLNGEGLRVVLWLSGCEHGCPGCQNPLTWDCNSGISFDEEAKRELFEKISRDHISGLTLSGGDPFFPGNRSAVLELLQEIKSRFPEKNIWVYTGYTYEELVASGSPATEILSLVDVLVDGPFIEEKKDNLYHWAGSTNQRVLRLKNYSENTVESGVSKDDRIRG